LRPDFSGTGMFQNFFSHLKEHKSVSKIVIATGELDFEEKCLLKEEIRNMPENVKNKILINNEGDYVFTDVTNLHYFIFDHFAKKIGYQSLFRDAELRALKDPLYEEILSTIHHFRETKQSFKLDNPQVQILYNKFKECSMESSDHFKDCLNSQILDKSVEGHKLLTFPGFESLF
jgi:hypothetical protein